MPGLASHRVLLLVALLAGLLLGCAVAPHAGVVYDFFQVPDPDDPWSTKISRWQARALGGPTPGGEAPAAAVSGSRPDATDADASGPTLRSKYARFRNEQRRALARDLAAWIQDQAQRHYVPDGPLDHWATLEETLERDGDDCDGLELLVYHFLLELGFAEEEVYRAIVYRPADRQHHMVTLWFENPRDPWVIDPTGAMTSGMPRLSDVPGWIPLKIFSETEEFTALPLPGSSRGALASAR